MTLKDFLQLDEDGRIKAVNQAVCLTGKDDGKFLVMLYQLDGFYIEVYYHKKYSQVLGLYGFEDMTLLDPYLETMAVRLSY